MDIDEELKEKMEKIKRQEEQSKANVISLAQENEILLKQVEDNKKEIQERAKGELKSVEEQLIELDKIIKSLNEYREQLLPILGRPNSESPKPAKKQKPGLLIGVYCEALREHPEGLTSSETVDWAKKNRPEVKTSSLPAVMSRGFTDGKLTKKGSRFFLNPESPTQY